MCGILSRPAALPIAIFITVWAASGCLKLRYGDSKHVDVHFALRHRVPNFKCRRNGLLATAAKFFFRA
jgi:hypothetical protein